MSRGSPEARGEPAFSGVFSGTFLSIVVLALGAVYGSRAFHGDDTEPREVAPSSPLGTEERATIALFESASPSVVFVESLNLRLNRRSLRPEEVAEGSGSGFVWDEDGHVVTNFHVVNGSERFQVRFQSGLAYPAELIGAAPDYDLAVLKVEAGREHPRPVTLGRSSDLRVGQHSFAIGYPFGLEQTLTTGVISGLDRSIQSQSNLLIRGVIQTDAAVNPGNSGGPLLDSSGRMIGVNTSIAAATGANTGVSFAVPVDTVNRIVPRILGEKGIVRRAGLGVLLAPDFYALDAGLRGAVIDMVTPGGPAERAGLVGLREIRSGDQLGDVIVGIDAFEIRREADLYQALEVYRAGDEVRVRVDRPAGSGRRTEEVRIRLAAFR